MRPDVQEPLRFLTFLSFQLEYRESGEPILERTGPTQPMPRTATEGS